MPYMTRYHMEISDPLVTTELVAAQVAQMEDPKVWGSNASIDVKVSFWQGVLDGNEETTWYEHERDMRQVSSRWPGVTFTLKGKGDDHDDEWVEYHRDGLMQRIRRGEWEPPAMDPTLLQ